MPTEQRPAERAPAVTETVPATPPRQILSPPFLLVVALLFLLLLLRKPDTLLNPQFWAEDGSIFFKDQLLVGLFHSLFHEYMGYLHFVPRLVAGFASWFPVRHAPFLYNLWATTLAALALSLFALPAYRFLIRQDYLRIAICAISAGVFSAPEIIGTITNIQWYLSIGALLLLFYPVPEEWARSVKFQLLSGGIGLIIVWTSPQLLIFLPIVLWKLHPFDRRRSIGPLLVIAGMMVQTLLVMTYHAPGVAAKTKSLLQIVSVTLATPIYRCAMPILIGDEETLSITARASTVMNVAAILAFLLWLLWLFRTCTGTARWSVLVATYTIYASIAVAVARRPFGDAFDIFSPWTDWGAGRYALLGSVLVVYLAALTVQQLVGRRGALVSGACLLGLFTYGLTNHYRVPASAELNWPEQAGQIESWIAATGEGGIPGGLLLRLNPAPQWTMYLPARLSAASPQSPWEGCLVRGQDVFGSTPAVFWIRQGKRLHIAPTWVTGHGLRWDEDVRMVRQEDLDTIPDAP